MDLIQKYQCLLTQQHIRFTSKTGYKEFGDEVRSNSCIDRLITYGYTASAQMRIQV